MILDVPCIIVTEPNIEEFLLSFFFHPFFSFKFFMQNKHPPRAHHMSKALG